MSSDVSICNHALVNLGDFTIGSLTDDTKAAKLCNQVYSTLRDEVSRAYPWNFAIKRVALARTASTPVYDYDYEYQLPTNPYCLKVLSMKEDVDAFPDGVDWRVEGRCIVTDSETCTILYIARITDPNQYDVLFQGALAARIAAEIAYALTGSKSNTEAMWTLYQQKIREARAVDAQEGSPSKLIDDSWLEARE